MKRSWLIGAALMFSLTAVGCSDDDDGDDTLPDTGVPVVDAGDTPTDGGGGVVTPMDGGGLDSGLHDGGLADAAAGDAGDAQ